MLALKVAVKSATVDSSDSAFAESKSDSKCSQIPQARPKPSPNELEKILSKVDLTGTVNYLEQEKRK